MASNTMLFLYNQITNVSVIKKAFVLQNALVPRLNPSFLVMNNLLFSYV